MKSVSVNIIHAFASNNTGGNPAGVVLNADNLTIAEKLHVARQVGLSETAFVSESNLADFKLDFFTPSKQIPHCGHATIATFSYLKQQGMVTGDKSSKETIDGVRQIFFEGQDAFMEQSAPVALPLAALDRANSLRALQLKESDLLPGHEPAIMSTGNNFLIVPVKNTIYLERMQPDLQLVEAISATYNLIAFYVYAPSQSEDVIATTRMFGPYYGIPEEAATGMAAGPLACYLDQHQSVKANHMEIAQGYFMNPASPSRIKVRLQKSNGIIEKVFAGGNAFVSRQLTVQLRGSLTF